MPGRLEAIADVKTEIRRLGDQLTAVGQEMAAAESSAEVDLKETATYEELKPLPSAEASLERRYQAIALGLSVAAGFLLLVWLIAWAARREEEAPAPG